MRLLIRELFVHSRTEIRINLLILTGLILLSVYRAYLPNTMTGRQEPGNGPDSALLAELIAFSESLSEKEQTAVRSDPYSKSNPGHPEKQSSFLKPNVFDPNVVSEKQLMEMGLNGFVAGNIVRYRLSGGKFIHKEDIYRIYGMDKESLEVLLPFIQLPSITEESESRPQYEKTGISVNLNSCTLEELSGLPAIGKSRSERIIKYRQLLGGFISAEQLKEVYGINDSVYSVIIPYITIDTSGLRKFDVRTAGFKELLQHPYLEYPDVESIIRYRDFAGDAAGLQGIVEMEVLPPEILLRISPYLR
jgi:competence ComEA-like helix-hairpin-helix protein